MVEIKIDTKKDSDDDIRKVINFLQKFISARQPPVDRSEDIEIPSTAMNIFNQETTIIDDEDVSKPKKDEDDDNNDFEIKPMFY